MDFLIAAHTDVGIRKKTNQDSVLIKVADTDCGKVCFAAVCDGMGGLRKGELASATLIRDFSDWFDSEFPEILYEGLDTIVLRKSWERVVSICAKELERYSSDNQVRMGTTAAVLLLAQHRYFILNIGDSRVYELTDRVWQMTKDQTFIQREMDMGRMTPEEARKDSRRNVLLQCVGASDFINPEFLTGQMAENAVYMLCSDGFRHVITPEEIFDRLNPENMQDEETMRQQLVYLTDLNKYRREDDNISAAAIRIY